MKLNPKQKGIIKECLNLIDRVNDADIIDDLNNVRHEVDKDEPMLTRFQCGFLTDVLSFWNKALDKNEVKDLLDKLPYYKTIMVELGSLLNARIYGPKFDSNKDPRKYSVFYDKLEPFVNAVARVFTKGEAWASANEKFINLLTWADHQGLNTSFLLEWYQDIERLPIQSRERGSIFDFNAVVAQE